MISFALRRLDFVLILSVLTLVFFGLVMMKSFNADDFFFRRQIVWLFLGLAVFLTSAVLMDWSFLKTNSVFLLILYLVLIFMLVFLIFIGRPVRGAASWLRIGGVSAEPVELVKPFVILILAKYFSKRHVAIARPIHLAISFAYAFVPMVLVVLQPDLGSAMVLGAIWLGMVLVGGIKLKHLLALFAIGAITALVFWNYFLLPYQKARIISFLNPAEDVSGRGYHAAQSVIAIGSGKLFGKGIGFGTQSRLEFLPEHEADFVFAAFAEEWGFVGVSILLFFFALVIWRILRAGIYGESNFEKFYAAGLAFFLSFQAGIHIGINAGALPITGLGMPFLSYGGSSLISLFLALGILESFSIRKKGIFLGTEEKYREGILGT